MSKKSRAKVVCLCGSTKFKAAYERAALEESSLGHVVLSVSFYTHADGVSISQDQKDLLDAQHLVRISMADEVLVLNVGGYIGESTRNGIAFAKKLGKPIRYLETEEIQLSSLELHQEVRCLADYSGHHMRNTINKFFIENKHKGRFQIWIRKIRY